MDIPLGAQGDCRKKSGNKKKNRKKNKNKNKNKSPKDPINSQEQDSNCLESDASEAVDHEPTAEDQPEVDLTEEQDSNCSESDTCEAVDPRPTAEGQPEVDLVLGAESAGPDSTVESTEPNATLASVPGADSVSVVTKTSPVIDSVSGDSLVTPAGGGLDGNSFRPISRASLPPVYAGNFSGDSLLICFDLVCFFIPFYRVPLPLSSIPQSYPSFSSVFTPCLMS